MKEITVPASLNLRNSLIFGQYLNSLEGDEDYEFDFGNLKYIGPFGLVYVSSCIEDLSDRCPNNEPLGSNFEHLQYPAHMGFFQIFKLDYGKYPGQASGSARYIPVTVMNARDIRIESANTGTAIGSIIEERSHALSAVLCQEVSGDLFDTVAYSIREILRNAVEHSHSDTVRYCAQFYPSEDRVEVVILDKGRGIMQALAANPFIKPKNHRDAINYALMPGVSGTAFKGSKINSRKDEWKNSGYGLYMTCRICRSGGDFFLGTGTSGMLLETGKKSDFQISHSGTVLRLTIKLSNITNLRSRLLSFSQEGQRAASKIHGTVVTPSAASHMLTIDYVDQQ